jgi:hypothetical protein
MLDSLGGGGGSPSQDRNLTQTQNEYTQTSVPRVEFEPTIPVFEGAKTVHASDRQATVIGRDVSIFFTLSGRTV